MLTTILGNKKIQTERPAFVMGILNVTEDSFWEKSRGGIDQAFELISAGADLIDVGAESTRPGYVEVSEELQIERLIPVIKAIREKSNIPISIDTRSSKVFKACYENGADILNDVSALEDDPQMAAVLASTDASVILMHRFLGTENRKSYENVTQIVSEYLLKQAEVAINHGVLAEKIIVDPGIGFGKTFEENVQLIKDCGKLCDGKFPVLMALSRKRCIGTMIERENTAEHRLTGTVTADVLSVQNGAFMIRVHDVQQAIDSLNVMKYLK